VKTECCTLATQLLGHAKQRCQANTACEQQMSDTPSCEGKMIAWRTDLYLVTLVHSVVQTCRAATRGIVAQNSDLIPMTFRRAIAQRVLPDKAARYVHVDMGARFERRQLASIEAGKFETDNTLGLTVSLE
jgi:hypothetical protein